VRIDPAQHSAQRTTVHGDQHRSDRRRAGCVQLRRNRGSAPRGRMTVRRSPSGVTPQGVPGGGCPDRRGETALRHSAQ
jgi:hypothetical protein